MNSQRCNLSCTHRLMQINSIHEISNCFAFRTIEHSCTQIFSVVFIPSPTTLSFAFNTHSRWLKERSKYVPRFVCLNKLKKNWEKKKWMHITQAHTKIKKMQFSIGLCQMIWVISEWVSMSMCFCLYICSSHTLMTHFNWISNAILAMHSIKQTTKQILKIALNWFFQFKCAAFEMVQWKNAFFLVH